MYELDEYHWSSLEPFLFHPCAVVPPEALKIGFFWKIKHERGASTAPTGSIKSAPLLGAKAILPPRVRHPTETGRLQPCVSLLDSSLRVGADGMAPSRARLQRLIRSLSVMPNYGRETKRCLYAKLGSWWENVTAVALLFMPPTVS